MSLETDIKDRLEHVLDEYFPKAAEGDGVDGKRGAALVLLAEAFIQLNIVIHSSGFLSATWYVR